MIANTTYAVEFYLAHGFTIQAVIEDDGLSLKELTESIQLAIDEDDYYQMHDMTYDKWTVIKANTINAFSIQDLGSMGIKIAQEGFVFK